MAEPVIIPGGYNNKPPFEMGVANLFGKFDYERTGTLMYADVQPDISGRANQMILLKNSDDSVNQALYLIDSNSYTGKGINDYDYIHEDGSFDVEPVPYNK